MSLDLPSQSFPLRFTHGGSTLVTSEVGKCAGFAIHILQICLRSNQHYLDNKKR